MTNAPPDCAARSDINVGVVEHQHRILAAQFEHYRQESIRRNLRDSTARCHASRKDKFVDVARYQRRSGRAFAGKHLKNVIGNSRLAQQLLQFERNQRRQL